VRLRLFLLSLAAVIVVAGARAQPAPGVGAIHGRVRLTAAAPANPPVRMGADPACSALWKETRPTQEYVVRAADGGLANAFAHLKGNFPATPVPSEPVVLDQHNCFYHPHVVGIRAGQRLEIRNSDPTTHNVHALSTAGNEFNMSRAAGAAPLTTTLAVPEAMMRLTCDIHSWMTIYVGVMSHPYFDVSRADGTFTMANVPPGRYALEVWHERYGPKTQTVDVTAGRTTTVEFTYDGTEKTAPAAIADRRVPGVPVRFAIAR
jgi:plastocyanin